MLKNKTYKNGLYLFVCIVIAPLLYLAYFNYPAADDFSYAMNPNDLSFFEIQYERYLKWTSRYFATAILITSPLTFGTDKFYWIYPVIFLILFFFSVRSLLKAVNIRSSISVNGISLAIISIFTLLVPSLSENYYWLPGSSTYFLPCLIFLLSLTACIHIFNKVKSYHVTLLPIYIFILGGATELIIGYMAMLLVAFIFFYYIKYKKVSKVLVFNLLFVCFIILFILLSPGNAARSALITHSLSLSDQLFMSLKKVLVINGRYLILSFALFFVLIKLYKIKINVDSNLKMIYLILGLNFVLFLGAFITIHSLGIYYPPRVENFLVFIGCIFSFLIAYKVHEKVELHSKYVFSLFLSVMIVYLFASINPFNKHNNLILMYSDIVLMKPNKFQKELQLRKNIIQNCDVNCEVPVLKYHPRSFYFGDITNDEEHFANKSQAEFYQLKSLKTK